MGVEPSSVEGGRVEGEDDVVLWERACELGCDCGRLAELTLGDEFLCALHGLFGVGFTHRERVCVSGELYLSI